MRRGVPGCLCCTVRSDLAPIIQKLWLGQEKTGRLDGIIVETTGLAVPNPVAQTFLQDLPAMVTRLDAVVTMVDSVNAERHLEQERQAEEAVPHQFGELGFKCAGLPGGWARQITFHPPHFLSLHTRRLEALADELPSLPLATSAGRAPATVPPQPPTQRTTSSMCRTRWSSRSHSPTSSF